MRDDGCCVLASVIPMFAWRSASAFHSFIQKQERGKISRALSSTTETNASFLLLFSFNLMKATIAVVACLTKAYTSGQCLQITSTVVRRIPWVLGPSVREESKEQVCACAAAATAHKLV